MANDSFPEALRVCLIEEGGRDDDPHDSGGRTNEGIIQREWDVYRRTHPDRPADVWKAPQADIDAIYLDSYWRPYCDDLPAGLDMAFFDFSVNAGRTQAVRDLQRVLGVRVDGMLGMATRDAIAAAPDVAILVRQYCDQRRSFYRHLAQYPRYGRGWMSRVDHVQAAAQRLAGMAHADPAPYAKAAAARVDEVADRPEITVSAKANPADLAEPTVTPEGGVVVSGGAGGLAGTIQQFQEQLQPFASYLKVAQYMLIGVSVVGFALTLYAFWKRNKVRGAV